MRGQPKENLPTIAHIIFGTIILEIFSFVVFQTVIGQAQLTIVEALQAILSASAQALSLGAPKSNHPLHCHRRKLSIWQQLQRRVKQFG